MKVHNLTLTVLLLSLVGESIGKIDSANLMFSDRRELFLDDYLIERYENIRFKLGEPQSAGVVLSADKPWEGKFLTYVTVVKDETRYRMYYRGSNEIKNGLTEAVTCYAESDDGIHWVKPSLGIHHVNGTWDNNVIMAKNPQKSTENFTVLYDDREGIPEEERYKAIGGHTANAYPKTHQGTFRYTSADGINWRRFDKDTTGLFNQYPMDSHNILTWVPAEQVYAIYLRTGSDDKPGDEKLGKGYRTIARSVSKDFVHWSEPEKMSFGDVEMQHLYTNATQPYFRAPQLLVAMPLRINLNKQALPKHELDRYDVDESQQMHISDASLMVTRGGTVYNWKFLETFVRPGSSPMNWGSRSNMPAAGLYQTSDREMSFYVTRGYGTPNVHVERMTLRLDGFASLSAGHTMGEAVTKPLVILSDSLSINFATSAFGFVKVVLLDEDGDEIDGFGSDDAQELIGDLIDKGVAWKSGRPLRELKGKTIRLKFILKDADLYSIYIAD